MIDAKRNVVATRLTVFPVQPGYKLNAIELLAEVAAVWPGDSGLVSLNVLSESLLHDLIVAQPTPNVMIEIPAFMVTDSANTQPILALHENGNTLLIKGRPLREMPRELLSCFKLSIVDLSDDRRILQTDEQAGQYQRSIGFVQSGIRTIEEMASSFNRGAEAVLGWPIEDAVRSSKDAQQTDLQVIVELIRLVDKQEPIEKLDQVLKRDPTLAFKLMRYINSPAFGLSVEITSFQHAIMMLGYQRLKRWLALLLVTASRDVNLRPVMFAAIRRGMLMEELVRDLSDDEIRGELFICGVFSLLDKMMGEPFSELLKSIPVPERVYQALAEGGGAYGPYIDLVRAVEGDELDPIREAADGLITGFHQINRAVLRALLAASKL
jgi:EAL and modified HD-GYP domain-containing signal transduction protein